MTQSKVDKTGKPFACSCGRSHSLPIREIEIGAGAVAKVGGAPRRLGWGSRALLIADGNTYEIVGRNVEEQLTQNGCSVKLSLFPTREKIIPDERALIKVLDDYDRRIDFMVAAGSGTMNDLTRYISAKTGTPYLSVPTAPSMDGYTSVVAPLIMNGFKKPHEATYPIGVYAEAEILRQAPADMIGAGFGDLLGKYIGKADWLLSRIINEEYYCEAAMDLVCQALEDSVRGVSGIAARDGKSIELLTEGLINTGIAMLWVGNSRPASGAEHIIAHFWEMKSLLRGEFKHLHGQEVAVGTVLMAMVYRKLLQYDVAKLDPTAVLAKLPRQEAWEADAHKVYGPLVAGVFAENAGRSFTKHDQMQKIERIISTAPTWRETVRTVVPDPEQLIGLLHVVGAPALPKDLDLSREQLRESLLHAQKSRSRYTILSLCEQLGILEGIAEEIVAELYS